jgi:hypothetical protein
VLWATSVLIVDGTFVLADGRIEVVVRTGEQAG